MEEWILYRQTTHISVEFQRTEDLKGLEGVRCISDGNAMLKEIVTGEIRDIKPDCKSNLL